MEVIFYTSYALLLTAFLVSMVLTLHGNQATKYLLWVWAALTVLVLPLINRANMISHVAAGLVFMFFLYVLCITVRYGVERMSVSREETRRALAESNRRVDGEWRILARRLHDEVNPQLLLTCSMLKQLEPLVAGNGRATELLGDVSEMLNDVYAEICDIIRSTRIGMVDSIDFTAALESLVAHYMSTSEKPAIVLEYSLPKRSAMPGASAISAYKIIREAIFNAIKHSKVAQVRVSVHHNKALNTHEMEITNDGVETKAMARSGEHADIGLIDIRERVRVLGGTLKIQATDPANQKRPRTKLSFSFSGQLS